MNALLTEMPNVERLISLDHDSNGNLANHSLKSLQDLGRIYPYDVSVLIYDESKLQGLINKVR